MLAALLTSVIIIRRTVERQSIFQDVKIIDQNHFFCDVQYDKKAREQCSTIWEVSPDRDSRPDRDLPPDRDHPPDRDPLLTETPPDRDPLLTETPMDRDPPPLLTETTPQKEHGTRDRDPLEGTWDQEARQEVTSYRDPPPTSNEQNDRNV